MGRPRMYTIGCARAGSVNDDKQVKRVKQLGQNDLRLVHRRSRPCLLGMNLVLARDAHAIANHPAGAFSMPAVTCYVKFFGKKNGDFPVYI